MRKKGLIIAVAVIVIFVFLAAAIGKGSALKMQKILLQIYSKHWNRKDCCKLAMFMRKTSRELQPCPFFVG